jgi:hypothetical protein
MQFSPPGQILLLCSNPFSKMGSNLSKPLFIRQFRYIFAIIGSTVADNDKS